MKPELSIIVPVYKVEPFLCRCIGSILAQTFKDFELILIDDGSPDNCGAICDTYAEKDNRIIVIHQKNAGVSAARNAGLDIARGTYIGFVDSDDWIEPEMYATMVNTLKNFDSDLVVCGLRYSTEQYQVQKIGLDSRNRLSNSELLDSLYCMPNPLGGGTVNKLYQRKLLQNVRFDQDLSVGEDFVFLFSYYQGCASAEKIPDALYNVMERSGSACRKNDIAMYRNLFSSCKMMLRLGRNHSVQLEKKSTVKYIDDCFHVIRGLKTVSGNFFSSFFEIIRVKISIIALLPRVIIHRLAPKSTIHGIVYSLLHS